MRRWPRASSLTPDLFVLYRDHKPAARCPYGLGSHTAARDAMPRLRRRGLVHERSEQWQIIDPLLADWLRRHSPFAPHQRD
jgi:hypothetical protein